MSEMQETSRQRSDELEKIDLTDLMLDFIHGIKRLWWLVVGLAVLFGAVSYFRVSSSYVPRYVASSTMAVQAVGGSSYINEETAEQMAEVFPYILSSGVLKDVVAKDLGIVEARVRQIEGRFIRYLRPHLNREKLQSFVQETGENE